jgi:carbon monoxide dehydrogenase subunit G
MASIRKEVLIAARPEDVWDAVRDVGAAHTRMAPGFLVDTKMDEEARIVTFANGLVLRELIVDIDDKARRFVWAAVGGAIKHHNGAMQVFTEGENHTRLVWIADILPHSFAEQAGALMEQSIGVAKQTLERAAKSG